MTTPLSPIQFPKLSGLKRRILPIASTAAAAITLTHCGVPERMLGMPPLIPHDAPPAAPATPAPHAAAAAPTAVTPESTSSKIDAFTADAAVAMQNSSDKIKAAAEKKAATPAPSPEVILAETHDPAPPAAVLPAAPAQSPIHAAPTLPPGLTIAAPTFTPSLTNDPALASTASASQIPMQLRVLDGPPGVTVNTTIPTTTTIDVPTGYTVYSPTKEPVLVKSPIDVAPALAAAPVKAPEPTPEAALEVLRKQAAAHPTLNTALALALLDQAQGKPLDARMPQRLTAVDQQLYQDLLASLDNLNTAALPTATLTDRAAPLVDAAKKWQADADLTLPKLALATRVESYGVYTSVDPKFKAGEKHTVIIYCEVANFTAKKTSDNWFETRLSQQETLATDDGLLLWRPNPEVVEDRSMNQRRDFYLVKKLTIPDNLAVGKYALRMSVTDLNTNKIAVVNLPIEITK